MLKARGKWAGTFRDSSQKNLRDNFQMAYLSVLCVCVCVCEVAINTMHLVEKCYYACKTDVETLLRSEARTED